MKIHLMIVDPQNDFCVADDGHGNQGALCIPDGDKDMERVAAMIHRLGSKIDDIHVTLDSHQGFGIERPTWWKRISDGSAPAPFTVLDLHPDGTDRIVKVDFAADGTPTHTDEEYTTYLPSFLHKGGPTGEGTIGYLKALKAKGRYMHCVWTVHCRVGSWGWSIVPALDEALCEWEVGMGHRARVNYVVKGNNPWTEHFSGVQAEVPDPSDPTTQVNTTLIQTLEEADIIVIAGQARTHCVANTVYGIADNFTDPKYIEKLVLLTDATSDVPGFEFLGDKFVTDMTAKGMKLSTTTEFLA
jgi:nicotinamidase/pyrazinamidase